MRYIGTHVTEDTPEEISPLGGNHDKWLAKHTATLKSKFPEATRFLQQRIHALPNEDGKIEVVWTAVKD